MKLTGLSISSFGRFRNREVTDLSEGIVVVFGPNEAGKSTLCALLQTLLYGFRPVSGFPYRSWHAEPGVEVRGNLRLSSGEEVSVWRRLASSPQGQLSRNGNCEDLANRCLPFLEHVNRELFAALYGLTQENARSLGSSQQQEIEDRLLGGLGPEVLRPARQVAARLESRAAKLWRPDNRGKPEFKTLRESLRQARQKRRQALERDGELRHRASRLEEVNGRIDALEEELLRTTSLLRKADTLLPIKQRLDQIEEWKRAVFDLEAVGSLPESAESAYASRCKDLEACRSRLEDLRREQRRQQERAAALTDEDLLLMESREELHAWYRSLALHEQEGRRLRDLVDGLFAQRKQLWAKARRIASPPFKEAWLRHLQQLPILELQSFVRRYLDLESRIERRASPENLSALLPLRPPIPGWAALVMLGLGAGLAAAGMLLQTMPLVAGGGLLALSGSLAGLFSLLWKRQLARLRSRQEAPAGTDAAEGNGLSEERDRLLQEIAALLFGLEIHPELLERPDDALCRSIAELQDLLSRILAEKRHLARRRSLWQQEEEQLQGLLGRFGEDRGSSGSLPRLMARLQAAEQRFEQSRQARERLLDLEQEIKTAQTEQERAEQALDELVRALSRATGRPPENGPEAAREGGRLQGLVRRIRELEERLEAEQPELPEQRREIERIESSSHEAWMFDIEEVERARQSKERILEELQRLKEERAGLQRDLDHMPPVSIGEIDGEIHSLQERMRQACTERDRLLLLSNILRSAERSFRERHQPDVLKRSGEYISCITQGRYNGLGLFQAASGEESLHIRDRDGVYHPMEPPLSTGTLDQIYLAFRLAVIDHLDAGREPLPLFLDEILINWDDTRLERGLELLRRIAAARQVFLCTCRESIASAVGSLPGASLLRLPSDEEAR
jgi:uncharacterized protein YhaN